MEKITTFLIGAIGWTAGAGLSALLVQSLSPLEYPAWSIVALGILLQLALPLEDDWKIF